MTIDGLCSSDGPRTLGSQFHSRVSATRVGRFSRAFVLCSVEAPRPWTSAHQPLKPSVSIIVIYYRNPHVPFRFEFVGQSSHLTYHSIPKTVGSVVWLSLLPPTCYTYTSYNGICPAFAYILRSGLDLCNPLLRVFRINTLEDLGPWYD